MVSCLAKMGHLQGLFLQDADDFMDAIFWCCFVLGTHSWTVQELLWFHLGNLCQHSVWSGLKSWHSTAVNRLPGLFPYDANQWTNLRHILCDRFNSGVLFSWLRMFSPADQLLLCWALTRFLEWRFDPGTSSVNQWINCKCKGKHPVISHLRIKISRFKIMPQKACLQFSGRAREANASVWCNRISEVLTVWFNQMISGWCKALSLLRLLPSVIFSAFKRLVRGHARQFL